MVIKEFQEQMHKVIHRHESAVQDQTCVPNVVAGARTHRAAATFGLAKYRTTHGSRMLRLSKGSHVTFGKKKEQGGFHFTFRSKFGLNGQH